MGKIVVAVSILVIIVSGFFLFKDEISLKFSQSKVFGENTSTRFAPTAPNDWFPKLYDQSKDKGTSDLNIYAKSALLVNFDTGDVLFAKDAKAKLPAGSTIKIMTAILALERAKLSDVFAVSEKAASVGEDSMNLTSGEQLSVNDLLYGLMLVSGNDAAITLAEGIAGTEDNFVVMMNERAKSLGLSNTFFVNASGLDVDKREQFTTAYDLVTMSRYAWQNYPVFAKIVSTEHKVIEANDRHKGFDLYNDTNLLTSYPGVRGIKPGFTWNAGLCLVTYAENGDVRLLAVILGSDDRRGEMKELLDYGFGKYGIKVEHPGLDL
ncbi:hypothetical protein A3A60_04065 [Candidatus Curtissbacteria bacterium RIFCSPLOWO2_01_FULL_42_26]|uniref:Peptidase S11 D-alanyl-D-alanine carboxypeptidase A N-terminal domain-containing protein n=1 Tax=Candidatus Curtissbacteria bacterium RIFCSPLOWO2_01_FULL_42_26 TaxID=1797729 RepID=A0A1F5HYU9_9BACT|nr:MAG: hypothetical protein A3A60_04065 [Candidatus Curtissbacteria bacterium RIFCSPLOWO2_01_FULL_42_26]